MTALVHKCNNVGVSWRLKIGLFCGLAVLGFGCSAGSSGTTDPSAPPQFKTVTSSGGKVTFRIPQNWKSEAHGKAVIYSAPEKDSGTLQISEIPLKQKDDDKSTALEHLKKFHTEKDAKFFELAPDRAMVRWVVHAKDDGELFAITYWEVELRQGNASSTALFSYMLYDKQMKELKYQQELKWLDSEIRLAKIKL